ncbi:type III pantothenate kinase [Dethiobacter alkaliphilus]|uniref:Type III pantothenate kinase n=1 Tax=Dethiobacter alkaliphilus AHT 1 TaxID=555088 RepID=C0GJ24_DETAL|nr:type III pantothenate kinase [Dethiobacter alkaliphilus]EEG76657.1 putative transcriptional acitvator, Baf family [Dethiobacter alkaliphilus AHT 1]
MLLAVDVGNTNIVLGVYQGRDLKVSWRVSTNRLQTGDEYGVILKNLFVQAGVDDRDLTGMIVSSVVPPLMFSLQEMANRYFGLEPLVVGPGMKTGLNISVENPREVGADRIVNAVAAIELYGAPLIIVDFGTATTFDAISEQGHYLGGAIAPGISISTEALFQRAAKLPRVELAVPKRVIGRDTITSMQSGIIYGFVGQVDGIVRKMIPEFPTRPKVIATGGLAELIARESEALEIINPLLTLEGLRIIHERNRQ